MPCPPRIACSAETPLPSHGSRGSGPVSPTNAYSMPHGCAKCSRSVPKRCTVSWAMSLAESRSAQKPIESAGTDRLSSLI